MSKPFCSACRVEVPDLEANHHVCVPDGSGGWIVTTRDEANAARLRAQQEGVPVHVAWKKDHPDKPRP